MIRLRLLLVLLCVLMGTVCAEEASYGISGNPGATNVLTGTGELGRLLQIPESTGIRLGGLWMGDYNGLLVGVAGAHDNRRWTGNSSLIVDLYIELNKAIGWKGGSLGAEFLQFDGQSTNSDAGVVQGYNSLPGDPPLNRSELYQLWIRQGFWDDKFSIRIGKTVPTYHFNNVTKPIPTENPALAIPSVSGLIYTPIFVNTTLSGVIGGYYNSVCGVVVNISPVKQSYVNLAVYDGNIARGVQTGLTGPHFNGYYYYIGETGYGWVSPKPGIVAVGGWYQSGTLKSDSQKEKGTGGIYAFGSQALWIEDSTTPNKGNLSGFFQFGWNHSKTLEMNLFGGLGLTAFGLVPKRPNDSFGTGVAWSRLNQHLFSRYSEVMFQAYYQGQIYGSTYFQPVISYIPFPGEHPTKTNVFTFTGRLIALF